MAEISHGDERDPLVALIVVAGLPGCGKSSFCKTLLSQISTLQASSGLPIPLDSASWHYVCYDSIEAELRGAQCDFDPAIWKASRDKAVELVLDLLLGSGDVETRSKNCASHRVILLDDNMYYRSMRKKWYRFAKEKNCVYRQVFLTAPVEVCLARNESREPSCRVPDFAIRHMSEVFEWPREELGHWELQDTLSTVIESCDVSTLEQVDIFIKRCHDCGFWNALPSENLSETQGSEVQSDVHVCDLALRRIVSQALAHVPKERGPLKSTLAKRWGSQKTQLMKQFTADAKAGEAFCSIEDLIHDLENAFLKSCIADIQRESL